MHVAHDKSHARWPAFIASKKVLETARNMETSYSDQLVSEWQIIQWPEQRNWADKLKSLKKKIREDVQIKKLIAAPCEAI